MLDAWHEDCMHYLVQSNYTLAGSNAFFCILTLVLIVIGVVKSRSNLSMHINIERRLIWQTTIDSVLLIIFFGLQAWATGYYLSDPDLFNRIIAVANSVFVFQRYPTIAILFIVR